MHKSLFFIYIKFQTWAARMCAAVTASLPPPTARLWTRWTSSGASGRRPGTETGRGWLTSSQGEGSGISSYNRKSDNELYLYIIVTLSVVMVLAGLAGAARGRLTPAATPPSTTPPGRATGTSSRWVQLYCHAEEEEGQPISRGYDYNDIVHSCC